MPVWVPFAGAALSIVGAVVAGEAAERRREREADDEIEGIPATPKGTVWGATVEPGKATVTGFVIPATATDEGEGDAVQVEPISQANGWRPVWVEAAQNAWLEWGACYNDWQQDIQAHTASKTDAKADDFMAKRLATFWDYLFDLVPVISWLVDQACFRVYLPATKLKVDGDWYFVPQSPRLPGFDTHYEIENAWVGSEHVGSGLWLPGWKPGTSRLGFSTKYPAWPLGWPPPAGAVTGGWVRNLGDITGTGYDTYQLVSNQDNSERSFPMMTEKGWRAVLGFSEYVFGGHYNGDPISMFNEWRGTGAESVQKTAATRKRATNRYQLPVM